MGRAVESFSGVSPRIVLPIPHELVPGALWAWSEERALGHISFFSFVLKTVQESPEPQRKELLRPSSAELASEVEPTSRTHPTP